MLKAKFVFWRRGDVFGFQGTSGAAGFGATLLALNENIIGYQLYFPMRLADFAVSLTKD